MIQLPTSVAFIIIWEMQGSTSRCRNTKYMSDKSNRLHVMEVLTIRRVVSYD